MASFFDKVRLQVGQKKSHRFDLSCEHYTTSDFFKLKPVYSRELVPGQKIKVNCSLLTRLSPLIRPMYGNVNIVNRAFFVPFRTVCNYFNEFITNTTYNGKTTTTVPTVDLQYIVKTFSTNQGLSVTTQGAPDYIYSQKLYKFTEKGKRIYDILLSLGYSFDFTDQSIQVSLLPIFAYIKVYYDWLANPAYLMPHASVIDNMFNDTWNWYQNASKHADTLPEAILDILYECSFAFYPSGYFTSAWDNPASPNTTTPLQGTITIPDITANDANRVEAAGNSYHGTPILKNSSSVLNNISEYALHALHSLTDFAKRNQIAGLRSLDRYLAEFGINLEPAKLQRSVYLGIHKEQIQISDVMANTDASNQPLGDYAGKGIGFGTGTFEFSTDEYGIFFIISTIIPKTSFGAQGRERYSQHITKTDFFTPEFDCLGVQAIRNDEFFARFWQNNIPTGITPDGIFGFLPRYAEYKVSQDKLTGDFARNSINAGLDTWHLLNVFGPNDTENEEDFTHSRDFTLGNNFKGDRIFADQTNAIDHFITVFHFDVESYQPMSPLFDNYEFETGETGERVVQLNGTQLD